MTKNYIEYSLYLIKNDDSHNFAFDDDDSTFVVDANTTGMLQNIGAKFANKLTILVVNLDLEVMQQKLRDKRCVLCNKQIEKLFLYFWRLLGAQNDMKNPKMDDTFVIVNILNLFLQTQHI